jgi:hypothetical protein
MKRASNTRKIALNSICRRKEKGRRRKEKRAKESEKEKRKMQQEFKKYKGDREK